MQSHVRLWFTVKSSQILHPTLRVVSTTNRTKTYHNWLNHLHKLNYTFPQRYYIWFPGCLTVLFGSDFYFIFLCCGIALKIELSYNLRWIWWTILCTRIPREQAWLTLSLLIIYKSIGSSNYLNKLRLSIKQMGRDLVNKPRHLI